MVPRRTLCIPLPPPNNESLVHKKGRHLEIEKHIETKRGHVTPRYICHAFTKFHCNRFSFFYMIQPQADTTPFL